MEAETELVPQLQIEVEAGDFDLRGFEITRTEFFDSLHRPAVSFADRKIKFSTAIVRKFAEKNTVELLVNPVERKFAIRPTTAQNRSGVCISKLTNKKYYPHVVSAAAFSETLYALFGWNKDCKYRIIGSLYEQDQELAYIFDVDRSEAYFKSFVLPSQESTEDGTAKIQPLTPSGKRIRAIPEAWTFSFGEPFYLHELSISALENQNEKDWKMRMVGRLFETGKKLNVTAFEELRGYIRSELSGVKLQEDQA